MNRIQILPPRLAEQIAAGEVIERPGSVVKELVENALDAGATEIQVTLVDGGRSLIEVLDNGSGMNEGDLRLSIERHATSKIRELPDLENIRTLGFRGEALPSIAAVSALEIVSREKGAAQIFELRGRETRPITFGHFLGADHGTRVRAHGLFSEVPARLKFLKSEAAEAAFTREWIERLSLTHPFCGFKLISKDRTLLQSRPQDEPARVRSLIADGRDRPLLEKRFETRGGLKGRAYFAQGLSLPHTRRIFQVVNGRVLKDRTLQQAVLQPFRQALLPGQFPALALFLDVPPSEIDVNVHPTKTEVRFLRAREVFSSLTSELSRWIGEVGSVGFVSGNICEGESSHFPRGEAWTRPSSFVASEADHFSPQGLPESREIGAAGTDSISRHPFRDGKFLGIAFHTYVLFDLGDEMALIDQHAAHERIRYETLKRQVLSDRQVPAKQLLLIPESIRIRSDQSPEIEARLPYLEALGFEAELFADDRLLFRAVPAIWGRFELPARLEGLVERLLELDPLDVARPNNALLFDEALFEKLASEACHSAIRAGDEIEPYEVESLMAQLFACEHPWNCPHGRPSVVRVPKSRFEEWFQRRL